MSQRIGLDANVLVYANAPDVPQHPAVRTYLGRLFRDHSIVAVVTPAVLAEVVHVLTDARRFAVPASMPDAIALAERYLDGANVECLADTAEALSLAFELMSRHRLGRKRIADTILTATLSLNGVTSLVTANTRDFAPFRDRLTIINPLTR